MGLILFIGLVAGCILGLIVTAILGGIAFLIKTRCAKNRVRVWRHIAVTFTVALLLLILAVHEYPYEPVKPGSDYDIAMKNMFLQGLGYCVVPGIAALLAALAAMLSPRKHPDTTQESNQPR